MIRCLASPFLLTKSYAIGRPPLGIRGLKERLGAYGFAGVASYGVLNTLYYVLAFLFFWTRIAKVPRGKNSVPNLPAH